MNGEHLRPIEVDNEFFARMREHNAVPRWVRLVQKIERGGSAGSVLSISELAAVFRPDGTCALEDAAPMPAQVRYPLTQALRDRLALSAPKWKYCVIVCDVDGSQEARVFEDEASVEQEFDYLDFDNDPIRAFVDEQQADLQKIGRAYYG